MGGRTRGVAIDANNSNKVIVGGVRGGIWYTNNNGEHGNYVQGTTSNESITYITQHQNQKEKWYASTGEYVGNGANFYGGGLLFSADSGYTWNANYYTYTKTDTIKQEFAYKKVESQPLSLAANYTQEGLPFQYASKVMVNPLTNSVFLATNGWGIMRSVDAIKSFKHNLPKDAPVTEKVELNYDIETSFLFHFNNSTLDETTDAFVNNETSLYQAGVFGNAIS